MRCPWKPPALGEILRWLQHPKLLAAVLAEVVLDKSLGQSAVRSAFENSNGIRVQHHFTFGQDEPQDGAGLLAGLHCALLARKGAEAVRIQRPAGRGLAHEHVAAHGVAIPRETAGIRAEPHQEWKTLVPAVALQQPLIKHVDTA